MNSNYCPHCGGQLARPNVAFCANCGRALRVGGAATQAMSSIGGGQSTRLLIQQAGQSVRTFIINKPQIRIGRESQNDVVVDNSVVSRQHAQIVQRGVDYWITDLGSANGTTVNGRSLLPNQPQKLDDGAIIRIGDLFGNSVGITFQATSGPLSRPSTIDLGKLNLGQIPNYTLGRDPTNQVHLDHPSVSRRHAQINRTAQGETIRDLGSANGTYVNGTRLRTLHTLKPNDLVQLGPFKLVYNQTGFTQYAPNGNYRLDAQNLTRKVQIGGFSQRLMGQLTEKLILKDVNLSIHPREFVALVGGSGAGKSTLMKAMSGFTPATGGCVLVNGDNLYDNFGAYRSILGYVPQDDIIHGQLPVRSALHYAAQLRLPDASPSEVDSRIQEVLQEVEMVDHKDKLISQLSGGQRKRVSIAVELLAEPGLFFLDEPTSGLDPGLEKKMMYTMRRLADGGRTIVLVTHATSNIDRCTHVAFMSDGELTYFGPPTGALKFFEATDFSDIYTKLSQPVTSSAVLPQPCHYSYQKLAAANPGKPPTASAVWADYYRQSPDYKQHVLARLQSNNSMPQVQVRQPQTQSGQKVSLLKQFVVLARRYFELIQRDLQSLVILLAVMPLIGFLLLFMADKQDLVGKEAGEIRAYIQEKIDDARENENDPDKSDEQFQGIYQIVGSTQRVLFIVALAGSLLGLFASSYEIIKEEAIYQRERMVNLKILPYLLSKMVVLAAFALIQCLLFIAVLAIKLDFPGEGVFLPAAIEIFVTLFLTALASIAMGMLISAVVRNSSTVIYVILVVLFVQILFAGAIFEIPSVAKPVSYLTTTRWSLEALGNTVNMPGLRAKGGGCLESEQGWPRGMEPPATEFCKAGQTTLPASYEFSVNYDHTVGHLLGRWFVLLGFTVLYCTLTAVLQKRKDVIAA
jgi:ABC transport system ATP-binding/permease protein